MGRAGYSTSEFGSDDVGAVTAGAKMTRWEDLRSVEVSCRDAPERSSARGFAASLAYLVTDGILGDVDEGELLLIARGHGFGAVTKHRAAANWTAPLADGDVTKAQTLLSAWVKRVEARSLLTSAGTRERVLSAFSEAASSADLHCSLPELVGG
jgi:hypothetical protein